MATSMLSGYTIRHIRKLQKDLFQTGLTMANPSVDVILQRWNPSTEEFEDLPPKNVIVRWRHDKKLIRVYGSMSTQMATSPTSLDGMFLAFDPFDVKTGDRFTLFGLEGRVNQVWPVRNSKRRASFTVEGDTRP